MVGSAAVTASGALPLTVRFVAMIITFPDATPLTRPESDTVAIVVSPELHLTGRSISAPRRSFIVTVACVVSPTFIELDARCTSIDATVLLASMDKLSLLKRSNPDESEHDKTAISEAAPAAELVSIRFTVTPMNRTTGFSWVGNASTARRRACYARNAKRCATTRNAVRTARIYIRQAKRSYRHYEQRWSSMKQPRRVARASTTNSQYRAPTTERTIMKLRREGAPSDKPALTARCSCACRSGSSRSTRARVAPAPREGQRRHRGGG